jgi:spore coat protein U-like protein
VLSVSIRSGDQIPSWRRRHADPRRGVGGLSCRRRDVEVELRGDRDGPQHSCAFTIGAHDLQFGNYTKGQPIPDKANTTINIQCAGPAPGGQQGGQLTLTPVTGNLAAFEMKNAANALTYMLCNDDPCTQPYSPGVPGPIFTIDRSAWPFGYTLYGQIQAGQSPNANGGHQTVQAVLTY